MQATKLLELVFGKMKSIDYLKVSAVTTLGVATSFFDKFLGGLDKSLTTALLLMASDLVTGFLVALIFKKSTKSKTGKVTSNAIWRGILKKVGNLIMIGVCYKLGDMLGFEFLRTAAIYSVCYYELISLIEKLSLIGVKFPKKIQNALEVLDKEEDKGGNS